MLIFVLGAIHKVRTQGGGTKNVYPCFGDAILLLKCTEVGEEGSNI